jgi:predicted NUDIX family phosphoesterase
MSKRVMTVPAEAFDREFNECRFYHGRFHVNKFLSLIRSHSAFVDRDVAESNNRLKQIVSCAVVFHNNKILCIRRSKKSNRRELKLRWTVMIGGHVEDQDSSDSDPLLNCMLRELREEVGIEPVLIPHLIGVVVSPVTPVGRLHVGAIFAAQIAQEKIVISSGLDHHEFVNSSRRQNVYHMFDSAKLRNVRGQFDPWTLLFLESRASSSLLNVETPILGANQSELSLRWS